MTELALPKRYDTVQWRGAEVVDVVDDTGEVRLRAVPYGVECRLGLDLWESFTPRAFANAANAPTRVKLMYPHNGALVGHASSIDDQPDALYATMKFARTNPALEARSLTVDGFLTDASIEFRVMRDHMKARRAPDGIHVVHNKGHLLAIALVPAGAYAEAGAGSLVLSARDEQSDKSRDERLARLRALTS